MDEWVDDRLSDLFNYQLVLMNIFIYKMVPSLDLTIPSREGQRDGHEQTGRRSQVTLLNHLSFIWDRIKEKRKELVKLDNVDNV